MVQSPSRFIIASIAWNNHKWREIDSESKTGFKYTQDKPGHESLNFKFDRKPNGSTVYGYMPAANRRFNRFEQPGIVFFYSKDYSNSESKIVGVYGNAVILKDGVKTTTDEFDGEWYGNVKAEKTCSMLFPRYLDADTYKPERLTKIIGQASFCYINEDIAKRIVSDEIRECKEIGIGTDKLCRILDLIENPQALNTVKDDSTHQSSPQESEKAKEGQREDKLMLKPQDPAVVKFTHVSSLDFMQKRTHDLSPTILKTVKSIIDDIKAGKYAIPIFQRVYTWKRKQIEELWESIFQGFFIGSILTWVSSSEQLAIDPVHGAPAPGPSADIVLDGQQRITSLFYAVAAPDAPLPGNRSIRFFLDLGALLNPAADSEDIVFSESTEHARRSGHLEKKTQFKRKIFPLAEFNSDHTSWVNEFKTYLKETGELDDDKSTNYYRAISDILNHVWFTYKIPVVQLPQSLYLDSVAEIFEKINSKGTRLGIFDLLNARLTKYGVALKDLWKEANRDHNIKEMSSRLDGSEKYILQGISLYKNGHTRRKELLKLDDYYTTNTKFQNQEFEADWLKICHHTSSAIARLGDPGKAGFGAVKFSFIPYTVAIPILSALMYKIEGRKDTSKCMEKIQNWYWSVVTSDSYSSSTDSKVEKDYREILAWFNDDNSIPEIVIKQRQNIGSVEFTGTRSNDSVYKAVLCIISKNGANDFLTDELSRFGKVEVRHIFPKLGNYAGDTSTDLILNKTLLSSDTNKFIGNKKPMAYIKEIIKELSTDESTLRKRLDTHLISDAAFACLLRDDFQGFIQARKETIRKTLKRLIMPPDLNGVSHLLHTNESQKLEYKSSMRWNMKKNEKDPSLEGEIAKELCAFMNSGGGDLLIGVDDSGNPIGLEGDYSTFSHKGPDRFSQHVINLINKYLGKNANTHVTISFPQAEGHEICHCKIKAAPGPVHFKEDGRFVVRTSNTCQTMNPKEAHDYMSAHWT